MKFIIRKFIAYIFYYSGLLSVIRKVRKRNKDGVIYMGHRVSNQPIGFFGGINPYDFDKFIEYLVRYYKIISLEEYLRRKKNNEDISENIVLTFDDGFVDNYEEAFPILKKYNIPATVYLTYDCVERNILPWRQRVGYIFKNLPSGKFQNVKGTDFDFLLGDLKSRKDAYLTYCVNFLDYLGYEEREAHIAELIEVSGIQVPENKMLTWDNIHEMEKSGITFGSHTFSHPLCSKISPEEAKSEIKTGRDLIESRLIHPVKHFAFPGGSRTNELIQYLDSCQIESVFLSGMENQNFKTLKVLDRRGIPEESYIVCIVEHEGVFRWMRKKINL